MLRAIVVVGCLVVPAVARAERPLSISVNSPVSWARDTTAYGGSVGYALARHHTVRINAAHYEAQAGALESLVLAAVAADSAAGHHGTTTDVGVAYTYYPRRAWDGLSLEAGLVQRWRDTVVDDEDGAYVATDSRITAARAQIGWSWLFRDRVFIAVAVGVSVGLERGTDTAGSDYHYPFDDMPVTTSVTRADVETEGLFRIGLTFDGPR